MRTGPQHEKLPWPGLSAKDHLSRVVTRAVKEAREASENELWADNQIATVLDYVSVQTAIRLLYREASRRRMLFPEGAGALRILLEALESAAGNQ